MLNWYLHSLFVFDSDAFDFDYGAIILRLNGGLDVSHLIEAEGQFVYFFICFNLEEVLHQLCV